VLRLIIWALLAAVRNATQVHPVAVPVTESCGGMMAIAPPLQAQPAGPTMPTPAQPAGPTMPTPAQAAGPTTPTPALALARVQSVATKPLTCIHPILNRNQNRKMVVEAAAAAAAAQNGQMMGIQMDGRMMGILMTR